MNNVTRQVGGNTVTSDLILEPDFSKWWKCTIVVACGDPGTPLLCLGVVT